MSDQAETIQRNADLCRSHGEGQDPEVEEHVLRMRKQQWASWITGQSELGRGAGNMIRANGSKTIFICLIKKMSFSFTICRCSLGLDKGRSGQRVCQCGMEPGLRPQQSRSPSLGAHNWSSSTQEVEAGGWEIQGCFWLC